MKTIIISDLHGDWKGLIAILRATGGIDAENRRLPDTTVIQLGDCIHGGDPRGAPRPGGTPGGGSDDELCAALALGLCDTILIGNHELPHLWPDAGFPDFGGQRPIGDRLRAALLAAYHGGQLVPAHAHERWLLTHAGAAYPHIWGHDDAGDEARSLRHLFILRLEKHSRFGVFDAVGRPRGGHDERGGIFWCDREELITGAQPTIPQIFGHTPQEGGYARHGDSWCVDANAALSGRVSALVQDEAGGEWRPVVVESEVADGTRTA